MKFYPENEKFKMSVDLTHTLNVYRKFKNFDSKDYVKAKCILINKYFAEWNLDTAVIALSGGVDSSLALALICQASSCEASPIKKIIGVTMPVFECHGVTNQQSTIDRCYRLVERFNFEYNMIEMSTIVKSTGWKIENASKTTQTPWSSGQSVPYLRTATLYSFIANLQDKNLKPILIGTTNRDEGSYLGYFGKASDGLTDLQIISDLHKSEVFHVANFLGVPDYIINTPPNGDMYDNRTDEEVFGASYDFVELYTSYMNDPFLFMRLGLLSNLFVDECNNFAKNVDALHKFNRHKYIGCSPSVHLDYEQFIIKDGWKNNCTIVENQKYKVYQEDFIGLIDNIKTQSSSVVEDCVVEHILPGVLKFKNVINNEYINELKEHLNKQRYWIKTDIHGKQTHINHHNEVDVGSYRLFMFDEYLANTIYSKISNLLDRIKFKNSDLFDFDFYVKDSVADLFRFIKYTNKTNGLIPHYDDTYIVSDDKKTLQSMLIYLTNGSTRFLDESRIDHNYFDYKHTDKYPSVLKEVFCEPGDILIFDHRLLHDSGIVNDEKIVIRTDIVYKKPVLGGALEGM